MLILGDVAGIQDFIFDLPAEERGGQARMLRARSFYVQILTEAIAFRIQRALGWPRESLLFCAAGKFALEGTGSIEVVRARVAAEHEAVEEWLGRETTGALRLAVAVHAEEQPYSSLADRYEAAMAELQRAKLRPWAALGTGGGNRWKPEKFVLPLPRKDDEFETFRRVGAALPRALQLHLIDDPNATLAAGGDGIAFGLPGFRAVLGDAASSTERIVLEADLTGTRAKRGTATPHISRPLARHIPTKSNGAPVWFEELASRSRGAPYLGILKMDADSLGKAINDRLRNATDLRELARFSAELDDFFAVELMHLFERPEWETTYTVFSGGDDLLVVGPWDRMLDLAGEVRRRFHDRFGAAGLTVSGGLAIVRARYPIRRSVAQAESLLERAKTIPAPRMSQPKDQLATLGQLWKWQHHAPIISAAKRLAGWVDSGVARRGRLHTLLQLTLLRRGELPETTRAEQLAATTRLAYHVDRNYPSPDSSAPEERALREWIDRVLEGFDRYEVTDDPEILFLPAIVRYALLATRTKSPESDT